MKPERYGVLTMEDVFKCQVRWFDDFEQAYQYWRDNKTNGILIKKVSGKVVEVESKF